MTTTRLPVDLVAAARAHPDIFKAPAAAQTWPPQPHAPVNTWPTPASPANS